MKPPDARRPNQPTMKFNPLTFFAFTGYWESQIQFDPDLIPLVNGSFPVFEQGVAAAPPTWAVYNIAQNVDPNTVFTEGPGSLVGYSNDTLIAFIDPTTNTSKVFPLLELPGAGISAGLPALAKTIASDFAANRDMFPMSDSETLVPLDPVTLSRSKSFDSGNNSAPEQALAFVRYQRQFNGYPVFGPKTQAMLGVSAEGVFHAFAYRWPLANFGNKTVKPYSRRQIRRAILDQLYPLTQMDYNITVNNVTVGYYDGGPNYFQPVYLFEVTVVSTSKYSPGTSRANLFGYVSVGEYVEPLPILESRGGPSSPIDPGQDVKPRDGNPTPPGKSITVARHIVRKDSVDWTNSANSFWDNLTHGGLSSNLSFFSKEYAFAQPFVFVSNRNEHINNVQIALSEVHGNWGFFTTYQTNADYVFLTNISKAGGYGPMAGGSLAYWILHSCEVIPALIDKPDYLNVWRGIFRGIHSVVGYRTSMYINDQVTTAFGDSLGRGAPVVSSWYHAVAASSYYSSGNTYNDSNTHSVEPLGRASSVSVCGHVDDTANNLDGIADSTCLEGRWMDN